MLQWGAVLSVSDIGLHRKDPEGSFRPAPLSTELWRAGVCQRAFINKAALTNTTGGGQLSHRPELLLGYHILLLQQKWYECMTSLVTELHCCQSTLLVQHPVTLDEQKCWSKQRPHFSLRWTQKLNKYASYPQYVCKFCLFFVEECQPHSSLQMLLPRTKRPALSPVYLKHKVWTHLQGCSHTV